MLETIAILVSIPFMIHGVIYAWNYFGGWLGKPGWGYLALRVVLSLLLGCTAGYIIGLVKTIFYAAKFVMRLALGRF